MNGRINHGTITIKMVGVDARYTQPSLVSDYVAGFGTIYMYTCIQRLRLSDKSSQITTEESDYRPSQSTRHGTARNGRYGVQPAS